MIRSASTAFVLIAVCCLVAAPADARRKTKPAPDDTDTSTPATKKADKGKADKAKADAAGKPVQLATFGDWGAYLAKGKSKTCYTLASPQDRKPEIKRGASYVFIADRPAEKVRNEVSIIMGYPMKETAPAQAKIGNVSFDLVAKGANAWIKNIEDEKKFVETLRRSGKLVVKAQPMRGAATTDTYVLTGFKQALDRVTKECK